MKELVKLVHDFTLGHMLYIEEKNIMNYFIGFV